MRRSKRFWLVVGATRIVCLVDESVQISGLFVFGRDFYCLAATRMSDPKIMSNGGAYSVVMPPSCMTRVRSESAWLNSFLM